MTIRRTTSSKRQKERKREERKQLKAQRLAQRRAERGKALSGDPEEPEAAVGPDSPALPEDN